VLKNYGHLVANLDDRIRQIIDPLRAVGTAKDVKISGQAVELPRRGKPRSRAGPPNRYRVSHGSRMDLPFGSYMGIAIAPGGTVSERVLARS
jgi:hypothetical protein